jgi:hypothetical protein
VLATLVFPSKEYFAQPAKLFQEVLQYFLIPTVFYSRAK